MSFHCIPELSDSEELSLNQFNLIHTCESIFFNLPYATYVQCVPKNVNGLYICPPYLYTVTTLPWEIQKSHFSTVLFIETSDYYVISEETNCNCCTAACKFTYCCLLLPIICVALFYGRFFSLVSHFQSHQCQSITGSFQSHQHLEERNVTCSQM